jgi:hypothetical protein
MATDPLVAQLAASIRQHVADMIDAAFKQYHLQLHLNQTKRDAAQAQTFHVLHMFLHNYFKNQRPRHLAKDGRTIAWEHLSDARVKWALIDHLKTQFIRTANDQPAMLNMSRDGWMVQPDKHVSTRAMAAYLAKHNVSGMAAPGVQGCGEPCGCHGNASKHLTGEAADMSGLHELGLKLVASEPGKYTSVEEAVDHFLHDFGLYRPLAHKPGKARELWHVEALPPHVPKVEKKSAHPMHLKHPHSEHHHRQLKKHAHHHAVQARAQGLHAC